jgi:hypothetical protein
MRVDDGAVVPAMALIRPHYPNTEEGGMRSDMIWIAALVIIVLVALIGWAFGIFDTGGAHLPSG